MQLATPAQTTAMISAADQSVAQAEEAPEQLITAIAGHITACFHDAERAKQNEMNERLLTCQRLRRGKYSPLEEQEIKQQGGSNIFINLTNIKCRAAESWIKDIMMAQGQDKPWTLEATPIPDLPPDLMLSITKVVAQEEAMVTAGGDTVHPDAFQQRKDELTAEILQQLTEVAQERARNMEQLIDDQLHEGGFLRAFRDFINDFCTFPTAILKGPVVRKRRQITWGANGPEVVETFVREFERVSPFDCYPAPDATDINEGFFIERHRLFVQDLEAMRGVPGYRDDQIDEVIARYGEKGYVIVRSHDAERDHLEARPLSALSNRNTIETLQFWGPVSGKMLKEWASADVEKLGFDQLDDTTTYEVEAWQIANIVIKATINPDPMGQRPYNKAGWDDVPGSFWGQSPPEIMADVQRMINACARALANNMAISSGPQVEIDISRLPPGVTNIEEMYPWKIWQTTADRSGGGHKAVNFFQPDSHAAELQATMDWFYKKADEVTGIPNYAYGSSQVAGAGRTASGLSMLMENASKGIRQAIANVDVAVSGMITRMFYHNMLFEGDDSIKGDCKIVAKGAMGLIAREALQARRTDFLNATANPLDSQIMGMEGRANLLRELARGLQMDVNKLIPDPDKLKAMEQAKQQQPTPGPDPDTLLTVAGEIVAAQLKSGQNTPDMGTMMSHIEQTAAGFAQPQGSQPPPNPAVPMSQQPPGQ